MEILWALVEQQSNSFTKVSDSAYSCAVIVPSTDANGTITVDVAANVARCKWK